MGAENTDGGVDRPGEDGEGGCENEDCGDRLVGELGVTGALDTTNAELDAGALDTNMAELDGEPDNTIAELDGELDNIIAELEGELDTTVAELDIGALDNMAELDDGGVGVSLVYGVGEYVALFLV